MYRLALNNFDNRLKPTKIQLCAALLDPCLANNVELFKEIQTRYTDTSRGDLILEYIRKYKMDDADKEPTVQGTQVPTASGSISNRQRLLSNFVSTTSRPVSQARPTINMEIEEYFEAAKSSDLSVEVTNWWGMNESKFPSIAKLARLVLAIPATSAAPESAFSISSCVITAKRSSISPYRASQVLFVHDNFDLIKKFNLN